MSLEGNNFSENQHSRSPRVRLCLPGGHLREVFYYYIFINGSNLENNQHIPASSCSAIIINHGDPVYITDNRSKSMTLFPGVYFKGIQVNPISFGRKTSNLALTIILVRPEYCWAILQETAEVYSAKISGSPPIVNDMNIRSLTNALRESSSFMQKKEILDQAFITYFEKLRFQLYPNDLVAKINHIVLKFQGSINVNNLTTLTDIHIRALQRKSLEMIGTSPYKYIRLVRTEYVLASILYSKAKTTQDLVYEFGFFDQSHLINDLKKYVLRSPLELIKDSANLAVYKRIIKTRFYQTTRFILNLLLLNTLFFSKVLDGSLTT